MSYKHEFKVVVIVDHEMDESEQSYFYSLLHSAVTEGYFGTEDTVYANIEGAIISKLSESEFKQEILDMGYDLDEED